MIIWDSESEKGFGPATEDAFYISIDGDNGILRLNDYHANGMHTTVVGFLGPKAESNAKKWDKFVGYDEENEDEHPTGLDMNCDTEKMLKACFELS